MINVKTVQALFLGYKYAHEKKDLDLITTFEISIHKALSLFLCDNGFNGYPVSMDNLEITSCLVHKSCECGFNCLVAFEYLGLDYEFCMLCSKLSTDDIGKG